MTRRMTATAFACLLVTLGLSAKHAAAAVVNVSTAAQLAGAAASVHAGDTIVLAPGVYVLPHPLPILVDVIIQGDPSAPSIIDGNGDNILILGGYDVRAENLTLRNGAIAIAYTGEGHLLVRGVTITGNSLLGIGAGDGDSHVTVVNSTIAGNVEPHDVPEAAVGIAAACSSFSLFNVTVADNDRGVEFGTCAQTFTVHNTVIARNNRQGRDQDCAPWPGFKLEGTSSIDSDGTCRAVAALTGNTTTFTTVPTVVLGPLADNGGPTMTMAAGSGAVDAGSACTEPFDQRGAFRDAACDIGAFERATAARIASATGAGNVDLVSSPGTLLLTFHAVREADMPNQAGKPPGVDFPYGFFGWSIRVGVAGLAADVSFVFPAPVPTPAQYWKVINGVWTDVCTLTTCSANGNTLTIRFRDGGIGDLDGVANTLIVDPGGLGSGGNVPPPVPLNTCLLYDATKAKKSGSAYPIKLQLCDGNGNNLSSPSIALHAIGVVQTSTNAAGPLDDTGQANPDLTFRYDASLAGYIFNLKTTGLPTGTYNLLFTIGSDPTVYSAPFTIR